MRLVVRYMMVIALSLGLLQAGGASAEESMSKKELQTLYSDYLDKEGFRPEIDEDGDVVFKREGWVYFINVSEDDTNFFSVVLPNIWPIESEEERAKVLAAADHANGKAKVTKVFTMNDNVWVATELYVAKPEDFKGVFQRAVSSIETAADMFSSKMKEEKDRL